jgi:hypothetical protein
MISAYLSLNLPTRYANIQFAYGKLLLIVAANAALDVGIGLALGFWIWG